MAARCSEESEDVAELEKPNPCDVYELCNPAMVELGAALDEYRSTANDRGYLSRRSPP